jgi:hypothetical protein
MKPAELLCLSQGRIQRSQIWRKRGPGNRSPTSYRTIKKLPVQKLLGEQNCEDFSEMFYVFVQPFSWDTIQRDGPCVARHFLSLSYACLSTSEICKLVVWFCLVWVHPIKLSVKHRCRIWALPTAKHIPLFPFWKTPLQLKQDRTEFKCLMPPASIWTMTLTKQKKEVEELPY